MTEKRRGLIIIGIIYIVAITVAVVLFLTLPIDSVIARIVIADIVATLVIFMASTALKNSSVYDPYWSVAPMVMLIPFAYRFDMVLVWVAVVIGFWGIRLTYNWTITFTGLSHQDWRYDYFKGRSKRLWALVNLFGIHLMPTVVVLLAMMPALVLLSSDTQPGILLHIGGMLGLLSTLLQWQADRELRAFRQRSSGVMQEGLWSISRHPNYLGEIMLWFSIYLMMLSVTMSLMPLIGALINLAMFLGISIPLQENRQRERRPDYEAYEHNTPMLIPSIRHLLRKTTESV